MSLKFPDCLIPNYPLKKLTTFGIGGPAKYFIEVTKIHEIQETLSYCTKTQLPYFILGKGSNILFDDRGFNGVVIANRIDFLEKKEEHIWHAGAGYSFSLLGTQTARAGLSGLEFASGIPGSVGGAVYMNAGANGRETCESLLSVDFLLPSGELKQFDRKDISFGYRFSSFQSAAGAIVGATFQLASFAQARTNQIDLIRYRQRTQPYGDKSAGCVFRNPENQSAGALIEKIGLKGTSVGGAQVSPLHANFLINTGDASAANVIDLIQLIKNKIKDCKGIELECEVRYIPYQE